VFGATGDVLVNANLIGSGTLMLGLVATNSININARLSINANLSLTAKFININVRIDNTAREELNFYAYDTMNINAIINNYGSILLKSDNTININYDMSSGNLLRVEAKTINVNNKVTLEGANEATFFGEKLYVGDSSAIIGENVNGRVNFLAYDFSNPGMDEIILNSGSRVNATNNIDIRTDKLTMKGATVRAIEHFNGIITELNMFDDENSNKSTIEADVGRFDISNLNIQTSSTSGKNIYFDDLLLHLNPNSTLTIPSPNVTGSDSNAVIYVINFLGIEGDSATLNLNPYSIHAVDVDIHTQVNVIALNASTNMPHIVGLTPANKSEYESYASNYQNLILKLSDGTIIKDDYVSVGKNVTISSNPTSGISSFSFTNAGVITYNNITDNVNLNLTDLLSAITSNSLTAVQITSPGSLVLNSALNLSGLTGGIAFTASNDITLNSLINLNTGNLVITSSNGDILVKAGLGLSNGDLVMGSTAGGIIINGNIAMVNGSITLQAQKNLDIGSGVQIKAQSNTATFEMTAGSLNLAANATIDFGTFQAQVLKIKADTFTAHANSVLKAGAIKFNVTEAEFLGSQLTGNYEVTLFSKSGGTAQKLTVNRENGLNAKISSRQIALDATTLTIDNSDLVGNLSISLNTSTGSLGAATKVLSESGQITLTVANKLEIAAGSLVAPILKAAKVIFYGLGSIVLKPYAIQTQTIAYDSNIKLVGQQNSMDTKPQIFGLLNALFTGTDGNMKFDGLTYEQWPHENLLLASADGKIWPKGAIDATLLQQANQAYNKAASAKTNAENAISQLVTTQQKAQSALNKMQELLPILNSGNATNQQIKDFILAKDDAQEALDQANDLEDKAKKAKQDAIEARAAANEAKNAAYEAGSSNAYNRALAANDVANEAETKAKEAESAAVAAREKAKSALAIVPNPSTPTTPPYVPDPDPDPEPEPDPDPEPEPEPDPEPGPEPEPDPRRSLESVTKDNVDTAISEIIEMIDEVNKNGTFDVFYSGVKNRIIDLYKENGLDYTKFIDALDTLVNQDLLETKILQRVDEISRMIPNFSIGPDFITGVNLRDVIMAQQKVKIFEDIMFELTNTLNDNFEYLISQDADFKVISEYIDNFYIDYYDAVEAPDFKSPSFFETVNSTINIIMESSLNAAVNWIIEVGEEVAGPNPAKYVRTAIQEIPILYEIFSNKDKLMTSEDALNNLEQILLSFTKLTDAAVGTEFTLSVELVLYIEDLTKLVNNIDAMKANNIPLIDELCSAAFNHGAAMFLTLAADAGTSWFPFFAETATELIGFADSIISANNGYDVANFRKNEIYFNDFLDYRYNHAKLTGEHVIDSLYGFEYSQLR
jgi:hypothetical protein